MKKTIIFLLFFWITFDTLAIFLKNDTNQIVTIVSFSDAQGWQFPCIPAEIHPKEVIEIQNVSYRNGQCKRACLEHLSMVMQTDCERHAFIMSFLSRDLGRICNGVMGLTFGIPENTEELRRYYKMQEKFPGQLNVRVQNTISMKSC